MQVDNSKPVAERQEKVNAALKDIGPLLDNPRQFQNDCETVFAKFRVACVHLRKDKEALDEVENKEIVWRFLCKLCKTRPFLNARCEEVLKILLMSEKWKQALVNDPESNVDDLPDSIKDQMGGNLPKQADCTPCMNVVVQCCSKGVLSLLDQRSSTEIGCGMHIAVSFLAGASAQRVCAAARSLLTAKLIPGRDGQKPDSVVAMSRQGDRQGIIVVPQPSLGAVLDAADGQLKFSTPCTENDASSLYSKFVDALKIAAEELIMHEPTRGSPYPSRAEPMSPAAQQPQFIVCPFGARHDWELKCEGCMHSFTV